jgi:hypothetical protein
MSIRQMPTILIPSAPLAARRWAIRAPRSWPMRTMGIVVGRLLDVRATSVFSAVMSALPMESLSLFEMGALAPYPGISGTNIGASEGSSGVKCLHLHNLVRHTYADSGSVSSIGIHSLKAFENFRLVKS